MDEDCKQWGILLHAGYQLNEQVFEDAIVLVE